MIERWCVHFIHHTNHFHLLVFYFWLCDLFIIFGCLFISLQQGQTAEAAVVATLKNYSSNAVAEKWIAKLASSWFDFFAFKSPFVNLHFIFFSLHQLIRNISIRQTPSIKQSTILFISAFFLPVAKSTFAIGSFSIGANININIINNNIIIINSSCVHPKWYDCLFLFLFLFLFPF